jgi:hypothetical protein
LGLFATNNEFTTLDLEKRWNYIYNELQEQNIQVECFSSDGAATLLAGMKCLTNFGSFDQSLNIELVFNPKSEKRAIQDTIHLVNKLKMQLYDNEKEFWMNNCLATGKHLLMLVENTQFSRLDHKLLLSDVSGSDFTKDKMNFPSTDRMCSQKVIDLLATIPGTIATCHYLKLMRNLIDGFMSPELSAIDRLRKALYVLIFCRQWFQNLMQVGKTDSKYFISANCWQSIEINVTSLISLAMKGKINSIVYCHSQEAEGFFRQLRSMSTGGLTNVNFTVFDCIRKIEKIQTLEIFGNELKEDGFEFPDKKISESNSNSSLDSMISIDPPIANEDQWTDEILRILINEAENEVKINCAIFFGIQFKRLPLSSLFSPPNKSLLLRNEMKKYMIRNHNINEVELEPLILEDGTILGNHVVFKNRRFLNENMGNIF